MKRLATVLVAAVLAVIAWLLWGSGGGLSVDDMAGVYRFDPDARLEAAYVEPDHKAALWIKLFQAGLKSGTLTLKSNGSLTWTMGEDAREKGRWETKDDRICIFFKREGRREWPTHGIACLVRDGTIVVDIADPPFVLRKQ